MGDRIFLIGLPEYLAVKLSCALGQAGFEVHIFPNFDEAADELCQAKLVIIDEGEGLSGWEVGYNLYVSLRIPYMVVGRVSNSNDEVWKRLDDYKAEFYFRPPLNHAEIVARARAILRRYYWGSSRYSGISQSTNGG